MADQMSDAIIRLDVGGVHYTTTKSTLCRIPSSMLETMFNGSMDSQKVDGRYFIDRNGQLFQHILDYLRDGDAWTPPSDLDICRALHREAQFFCLSSLSDRLTQTIKLLENPSTHSFMMVVRKDKVLGYHNMPPKLAHWIHYEVKGCMIEASDNLINEAAELGYVMTSFITVQRNNSKSRKRRTTDSDDDDDNDNKGKFYFLIGFQSSGAHKLIH
jgi:hypothetical protein